MSTRTSVAAYWKRFSEAIGLVLAAVPEDV